ncbi:hypothetical protein BDZ94DRAFT_1171175 [Collybia nuda]|uniref:Flavin-containing monooxygenase n=1 Tax=Collybia nuda TaxID=64659 RepID=A0A9P5XZW8_9AGAR|nr:hypothetical protein BDZ94DRAFT_1171175 [Collybia nuda]
MSNIPEVAPPLPTLDNLNATVPEELDVRQVAKAWFAYFSAAAFSGDAQAVATLFIPDSFWRDMLSFTWDFRTFSGAPAITQFLSDRLSVARPTAFAIRDDAYLGLQRPFPDIVWINFMFDFETTAGLGSGIARLVPTANGEWKAYGVYTNLEGLKGFPEKIGALRNQSSNHGKWESDRRREIEFEGTVKPSVVVIGGGQSGLDIAARLKAFEIPTLVVEKNPRIGDNWRNRYEALCLHDPVYYDHMPYLPFPPTWPVFTPALKLANWLEHYAEALEINVWTSSTVVSAIQDASTSKWHVIIKRGDGTERAFEVKHLIFATGFGGIKGKVPSIPGMDKFKGQALHSNEHRKAEDHKGKKVVVVGACTSAHDISVDYYEHGIDVTMYQRSSTHIMSTKNGYKVMMEGHSGSYSEGSPPVEIADRFGASFPLFANIGMLQRTAKAIADLDKDILDALRNRGFRINDGILGTGVVLLVWNKAGGYYLDTGGSQLIADGKIKIKSGGEIETFTEDGLKFDDGSELKADVVVFATGLGDTRSHIEAVCGEEVSKRCLPIWGLNKEGEINGAWRNLGIKGLWYMMGNLAYCRFHSKHLALQIKAMEEGIFNGERYSLDE